MAKITLDTLCNFESCLQNLSGGIWATPQPAVSVSFIESLMIAVFNILSCFCNAVSINS